MLSLKCSSSLDSQLIWDWDSEWVLKNGSEGETPLQGPGAGSS